MGVFAAVIAAALFGAPQATIGVVGIVGLAVALFFSVGVAALGGSLGTYLR